MAREVDEVPPPPSGSLTVKTAMAAAAGRVKQHTCSSVNEFALNLLSKLVSTDAGKSTNLFFSPLSVSTILAIVSQGAGGTTRSQLLTAISANQEEEDVLHFFQDICNSYASDNAKSNQLPYRLVIANRVLLNQDERNQLRPEFSDNIKKQFKTSVEEVDFRKGSELLASINNWINNQTDGLIKSLFNTPPNVLTKLLLLNTIYFKGTWLLPFEPKFTTRNKFRNKGDTNNLTDVEFMKAEDVHMKYLTTTLNGQSVEIIEVPYQSNISMYVILPDLDDGLFTLTHDKNRPLSYHQVNDKLAQMKFVNLDIVLPKFKLETQYLMNEALQSLGINDAFDVQTANFTGIRDQAGLFITDVFHKAVIEVTEDGTVAAAATCMDVVEGVFDRSKCPKFCADHPFLFIIKDNSRNLILFVGETIEFVENVQNDS